MDLSEGTKLIINLYTEEFQLHLSKILIISRVLLDFGQHFQARRPMRALATVLPDKQPNGME
jgi:hypothetical protein